MFLPVFVLRFRYLVHFGQAFGLALFFGCGIGYLEYLLIALPSILLFFGLPDPVGLLEYLPPEFFPDGLLPALLLLPILDLPLALLLELFDVLLS